ncbi:hypothetical protein C2845_PM05G23070 [Panicum miliaceum]|uniref:J domain-containing protein n=1 Tax=Panicum miliaceum TaxID=4540 RepID=A0A3L6T1L8_PANMI|nr:hypothetical protein C2845_PM05G23070 [Panicum miliaceum]
MAMLYENLVDGQQLIAELAGNQAARRKISRIAQRLDPSVPFDDLLSPAEKFDILNGATCQGKTRRGQACENPQTPKESFGHVNVDQVYTEENIRVGRDIRKKKDYYAVLGVERRCSVEEIRKAYRRLSLKRPEYSLQKTYYFPISKVTQKHGVEYFVSKLRF